MRNGQLALERGLHQEIGWERSTSNSDAAVVVYADRISNPVMEGMRIPAPGESGTVPLPAELLYDSASGMVRASGLGYSAAGVAASAQHKLPAKAQVRVSYASGSALVLGPASRTIALTSLLSNARARHAQTYSISLSGTLDGSGTRWRATYRWQPESTLTSVASFSENTANPYLNLELRQPLHLHRDSATGFEALLSLRNLLAQGYQPYVLSDGSMLVFAQDQRGVSGGLAFTF
jgi:hypothetical protein